MTSERSDISSFYFQSPTGISGIKSCILAIEKSSFLCKEESFGSRTEVIDFIEFQIVGQIEGLLQKTNQQNELILLKHRAEKVKEQLEEINVQLFRRLQKSIQTKRYTGKRFNSLINKYIEFNLDDNENREEPDYDNLDVFINGLLPIQTMPEQVKDLEPEMVYYQKTPARIVFELVEKCQFTKDDVFFDLGSGLGQVAILVNLLAGITVTGVEFEPAFCRYARDCAAELDLSNVNFINVDARKGDYSEGTVFFMFTPFKGEMLQEVLEVLRKESQLRKIKIITYGPCTAQVALQTWLDFAAPKDAHIYKLGLFSSF